MSPFPVRLLSVAFGAAPAFTAPLTSPLEAQDAVGSASLQIAGTRLTVSPASQTVPFQGARLPPASSEPNERNAMTLFKSAKILPKTTPSQTAREVERSPVLSIARLLLTLLVCLVLAAPLWAESSEASVENAETGQSQAEGEDPATPDSPAEREAAIRELYELYQETVDPLGERLQIHLDSFAQYLPSEFWRVDMASLVGYDPQGVIELRKSWQSDGQLYRLVLEPRFVPISGDHARELALKSKEFGRFDEVIAGPLLEKINAARSQDADAVQWSAISSYWVDVSFDDMRLRYPAFGGWLRESGTGEVLFQAFDTGLQDLQRVRELAQAKVTGIVDPAGTPTPRGALEKSSGGDCRVDQPADWTYPDVPAENPWHTGADAHQTAIGSLRVRNEYGHDPNPLFPEMEYHSFEARPSVRCSCGDDCTSTSTMSFSGLDMHEPPFVFHSPFKCHEGPIFPAVLTGTGLTRRENGRGAYGNGAFGWGIKDCFNPVSLICYCGEITASFGVGVKLSGAAEIGPEVQVKLTPDPILAWTVPTSVSCPDCTKIYRLNASITGLTHGEEIHLWANWDEENGTSHVTEQELQQLQQSGVVSGIFPERLPDGSRAVVTGRVTNPATPGESRICANEVDIYGPVGAIVQVPLDCTCVTDPATEPAKSAACVNSFPVLGEIKLDARVMNDDMTPGPINGVGVRFTATPPAGDTTSTPWEETVGPFSVGSGASVTIPLEFDNTILEGWSWLAYPTNIPTGTECFSTQITAGVVEDEPPSPVIKCFLEDGEPSITTPGFCSQNPNHEVCHVVSTGSTWFYQETCHTTVISTAVPGPDEPCPEPYQDQFCSTTDVSVHTEVYCYAEVWQEDWDPGFTSDPVDPVKHAGREKAAARRVATKNQADFYRSPTVDLTSYLPTSSSSGAPVVLKGSISDPDGVSEVWLELDGVELPANGWNASTGQLDSSVSTDGLAPGQHNLTLLAIDNRTGNRLSSKFELSFDIGDACAGDVDLPAVSFTPTSGKFASGSTVPINIQTSDSSGIDKVRFFVDGTHEQLFQDPPASFTHNWTAPSPPASTDYLLLVRSFDNCGKQNDVSHTLTVCDGPLRPSVSLTSPTNGATLTEGTSITLAADASDDHAVTKVQFLNQNNAVLGTDTTAPYQLNWTATAGTTQIKARAFDGCGNKKAVTVSVTVTSGTPPARVQVSHGSNILDYGETKDFGTFDPGIGNKNRGITVSNIAAAGADSLEWGPVQVVNLDGAAFSWGGTLVSPLAPGAGDNFAVILDTSNSGQFRALVKVWHSDPSAANPHQFYVTGTVRTPQTATFNPTKDSWVKQTSPDANKGTQTRLWARSTVSGDGRSTYIGFTVSGVTGSVQSAKLRIRTTTSFPSSRIYWITSNSWSETGITWNNAPLGFHLQRELGSLSHGWVDIDVSDIVSGNGSYTLGFTAADVSGLGFYSRESGSPPQLIVNYLE